MADNKSEHAGHRQRMRKKYLEHGIEIFEQQELLEILLYYTNSRKDTSVLSHDLIEKFGSVSAVLDSPYNFLVSSGVSENTAFFLSFLPDLLEVYRNDKIQNKSRTINQKFLPQKLAELYLNGAMEYLYIILLDSNYNEVYSGTVNNSSDLRTKADISMICELALRYSAMYAVISYSRKNGEIFPTSDDVEIAIELYQALNRLNIFLKDVYIISEQKCISFKEAGILFKSKEEFENSSFYDNPLFT